MMKHAKLWIWAGSMEKSGGSTDAGEKHSIHVKSEEGEIRDKVLPHQASLKFSGDL